MAAFVLFVVAVAGAVVVADLVWENPTAGQITVFQHTITGYPEGWLLAIAAGLGIVVALLLAASVNSTKGRRARRKQLRRLRHDLEDQVAAPEPDHARLLDAFFGPEEPSRYLDGPARLVELESEDRESRADDHQRVMRPKGSAIRLSRSTSRPGGPLGLARTGTARSRPARDAGGSGARRGSRRQGAARTRWSHAGATGLTAPD